MTMTDSAESRLYLVRHGESLWNSQRRIQGQADPPLSDLGKQQARALANVLSARPLDAVYCSPLARACETAACIAAPHGMGLHIEDNMREINLGDWQGRTAFDLAAATQGSYQAWNVNPTEIRPPGGETLHEALARISPVIDAITTSQSGRSIVVVTHSIVGRVLLCHLLGMNLDLVARLKLKPASITKLRLRESGAVLEQLGCTDHLR